MLVKSISNIKPVDFQIQRTILPKEKQDSFFAENKFINKKPLVDRKIISSNQNINDYFKQVSRKIFPEENLAFDFENLLKLGYVSLSSNAYFNLSNPKSAIGVVLDPNKKTAQHLVKLEEHLKNGVGVGINFSKFENPTDSVKKINQYFKYREPNLCRAPAGIALLDINHPKVIDFIGLKDDADYKNWCFDLSVILDDDFLNKVDKKDKNALEIYDKLLDSMLKSGEPGIIFSSNKDFLCDSCAAAELKENEGLNLAQINLSKFYSDKMDYEFLSKSANLLSIALKRIAPNGFISVLGYQDLLNKMHVKYGTNEALDVLEKSLKTIQKQAHIQNIRLAISPSGTISRVLKVAPSIEPINTERTYDDEIKTMAVAQKYLDGGISKTINLKQGCTKEELDLIIRNSNKEKIKGISVFPAQSKPIK